MMRIDAFATSVRGVSSNVSSRLTPHDVWPLGALGVSIGHLTPNASPRGALQNTWDRFFLPAPRCGWRRPLYSSRRSESGIELGEASTLIGRTEKI
jgi:hypothetical protein